VRLLDDPIRASYVGILILITLLIVFAASWMGIYLARQITVPVQLLAEGTEEVARGNLDVSLDYRSSDEFGTLVASFNRMTADLKAMKGTWRKRTSPSPGRTTNCAVGRSSSKRSSTASRRGSSSSIATAGSR